jgi:hypothetical protein
MALVVAAAPTGGTARDQWRVWAPVGYLDLVEDYRGGDAESAIAEVCTWSRDRTLEAASSLVTFVLAATDDDPRAARLATLEAALLLHTEAAIRAGEVRNRPAAEVQAATADALLARLDDREMQASRLAAAARLVPTRDWLLVMAGWRQGQWQLDLAGELLERARRIAPGDAQVLLASGMLDEAVHGDWTRTMAHSGGLGRGLLGPGQLQDQRSVARMRDEARVRARLADAAGRYRAAIAADAGLHEARVRLARAEMLRGNGPDADSLLSVAREGSRDPAVLYLAEMFTARRAATASTAAAEAAAYERAHRVLPHAQAARIGLAHALERAGRTGEARAILRAALAEPRSNSFEPDPWWDYQFGYARYGTALLDELRRRVRTR